MYSLNSAVLTTGSEFFRAGINENVKLKEVNVQKSPTGLDFIEFVFEKDGNQISMTEWKNTKGMWIKDDAELQRRDNQQVGRFLQILNCYYNELEDVSFESFVDIINWVKQKLDAVIDTNKNLRIKLVYDTKGYLNVSRNGIFVEPMDTEKSQVEIMGRDRLVRPVINADVETSDPLASANIEVTPVTSENHIEDNNDLPF